MKAKTHSLGKFFLWIRNRYHSLRFSFVWLNRKWNGRYLTFPLLHSQWIMGWITGFYFYTLIWFCSVDRYTSISPSFFVNQFDFVYRHLQGAESSDEPDELDDEQHASEPIPWHDACSASTYDSVEWFERPPSATRGHDAFWGNGYGNGWNGQSFWNAVYVSNYGKLLHYYNYT